MHNNTQTGEAHQGGPPPRQDASKLVDLSTLETESLALRNAAGICKPSRKAASAVPFEYLPAPCRQLTHRAASCVGNGPRRLEVPDTEHPLRRRFILGRVGSTTPARTSTETTSSAGCPKTPEPA